MQMTGRAETDVNVCQTDAEQTDPRPQHVLAVEAAHAVVSLAAHGRLGFAIEKTTDEVPERMAAKRVKREEQRIQDHDDRANAHAEVLFAQFIREPHGLPRIV